MDLGISQLTDDQLFELLQETCVELGNRDPFLRKMAQSVITDEADRLKLKRQAIHGAIAKTRKAFVQQLEYEIRQFLNRAIQSGEYQPLSEVEASRHSTQFENHLKNEFKKDRIAELEEAKRSEIVSALLAGNLNIYSREEQEKMIVEATTSAELWVKKRGIISIATFKQARQVIFDNLKRMGHSEEAIMEIYGPPEGKP